MSNTALLLVFALAFALEGKRHFLSALLTLAFNKAYFTAFDNYLIIILICLISAFPDFIEKKVNGVTKLEMSFNVTIRAFLALMVICWYFEIINPIKDFKVMDFILTWIKSIGDSALQYLKRIFLDSWF